TMVFADAVGAEAAASGSVPAFSTTLSPLVTSSVGSGGRFVINSASVGKARPGPGSFSPRPPVQADAGVLRGDGSTLSGAGFYVVDRRSSAFSRLASAVC